MSDIDKPAYDGPINDAGAAAQAAAQDAPPDAAGLAARNADLEGQIAELTDRLLRAHADMDNQRKRTERDKADSAKYAISKFALDIVGISDNFQRAVSAVPPGAGEHDGTLKSLVEGVVMTERAFLQVLERHGVRRIDPMGEPFNPNIHQAVMEQENPAVPAGSVVQVFQPGFMIEDRVLRPAMVVVASGGAKAARPAEAHRPPAGHGESGAGDAA
jgi:molecular chaperone GrpE